MKQEYALHKRFIPDIDRFMNRSGNIEKVMVFAMNYLSLRQIHSDEISNIDLMEVVKKISFSDYEIPELYQKFSEELTDHQFIFRIRRVKYIANTKDSIAIVSSPLLRKIGKYLMDDQTSEVILMEGNENSENPEKPAENSEPSVDNAVPDEQIQSEPESTDYPEDSIEYLDSIWDDTDKRLKWLLKNMKYTNRKYNYNQENGYTPDEIGVKLNKSPLTVKHYVRRYLVSSNPVSPNNDETVKEN